MLALFAAAAAVSIAVTFQLYDPDLWQHLAVGRAIVWARALPHTHLWSWPTYGQPDAPPSWLFRVLAYCLWRVGGVWGIQAWRWTSVLGAFAFACLAARVGARRHAAFAPLAVAVLAALVLRQRSQARPETLAAVLLGAQLLVLEARRVLPRRRLDPAWALPAIQLVWANAHASWFLGPALSLAYLVDDALARRRGEDRSPGTLAAAIAASLAATALHPYGWAALREPFEFLLRRRDEAIYRGIGELQPVAWGDHTRDPLVPLLLAWPALMIWRPRGARFDVAGALVCAIATAVALASQRFLGLWSVAATVYVGRELASRTPPRFWSPDGRRAALVIAIAAGAALAAWSDPGRRFGVGIERGSVPAAACEFIAAHGIRGRSFTQFHQAGYLLWRFPGDPGRLPFMDVHQSGTRRDRDLYVRAFTSADAWRELDDERHFEWVLLDTRTTPAGVDLPDRLDADPAWALVFVDDLSALWLRHGGALADSLALPLPGGPRGNAALLGGSPDPATAPARIAALERMIASSPEHRRMLAMLVAFQLGLGRADSATAWVDRGRREYPDDPVIARLAAALDRR